MLEEQQREKDKVKDRLHLIRQMKGTRGPRFATAVAACSLIWLVCHFDSTEW